MAQGLPLTQRSLKLEEVEKFLKNIFTAIK
jgi:hypothetical protein